MKQFLVIVFSLAVVMLGACSEPDKPSISLFLAVERGDLDQLERHIYWGTDINAALPNGQFPLHTAAHKGRFVMVRNLLKHGAQIDQQMADGSTALDVAILAGRTQVAELLLKEGAQLDASALLAKAAQTGSTDRDTVRFLIARGADTEFRDASGDTPLLTAIRQDNHRLASHLVSQGADVNAATADGKSALQLAKALGLPEIVSLLTRQGAR